MSIKTQNKTQKRHWLLLRGLGRDKRHWGEFVSDFEQAFAGDQVSTLDTCGNGDFAADKCPLNIKEYTEHCRSHRPGPDQKVHLVALSLGGMIALDWAQRYPDEVASITLINTSAANLTSMIKRIYPRALYKLVSALVLDSVWQPNHEAVERTILQVTSNQLTASPPQAPHTLPSHPLAQWTQFRADQQTTLANLVRQLVAASRFKAKPLNNLKPLILTSRADKLVNCMASADLRKFYDATMAVHPSAGHDLPLDDGAWVIGKVKGWLVPVR